MYTYTSPLLLPSSVPIIIVWYKLFAGKYGPRKKGMVLNVGPAPAGHDPKPNLLDHRHNYSQTSRSAYPDSMSQSLSTLFRPALTFEITSKTRLQLHIELRVKCIKYN